MQRAHWEVLWGPREGSRIGQSGVQGSDAATTEAVADPGSSPGAEHVKVLLGGLLFGGGAGPGYHLLGQSLVRGHPGEWDITLVRWLSSAKSRFQSQALLRAISCQHHRGEIWAVHCSQSIAAHA